MLLSLLIGPDPPVLSLSGVNLMEEKVVASFGSQVTITCIVQEHGFVMTNTTIEWRDPQVKLARFLDFSQRSTCHYTL